jgi:hypothetical protein
MLKTKSKRASVFINSCFAVFCISIALVVQAEEKIEFQATEEFKSLVVTNEVLALSGVDVVTLTDGKTYILGIGRTANQALHNSNARSKLNSRKVAEAKAGKTAAEFLKVEISTESRLFELKKTEKISSNEALNSRVSRLIRLRSEMITQKSQVTFSGARTVATWLSDSGEIFNACVAFKVEKNTSNEQ